MLDAVKGRVKPILCWFLLILFAFCVLSAAPAARAEEYTLPREDGKRQVTFYWNAENADLAKCDMWIWYPGQDGRGYVFHPCAFGGKVVLNVPMDVINLGFIVRRDCSEPGGTSWGQATKDYDEDRYAALSGDSTEIYLKARDKNQYVSDDHGKTLHLPGENTAEIEEEIISSGEELQAAFAQYRENSIRNFDLSLSKDYFEEVRKAAFALLKVQMLKAGLSDYDLKYTSSGKLQFKNVIWTVPHVAECASEAEVETAVEQFFTEGATAFQLLVSDKTLFETLNGSSMIAAMAAKNGAESIRLRYTLGEPTVYYIDQIKKFSVPYARCDSEDSFLQGLEYMHEQKASHFYLVLDPAFYTALNENRELKSRLEACSQMAEWRDRADRSSRCIEFTQVRWSEDPRIFCESEDDVVEAIRQMGASGLKAFNLILTKDLYDAVYEGFFKRLHELEADGGMSDSGMKYNWNTHVLMYENAVIHSDAVKLSTAAEANAYLADCVAQNKRDIAIFCTPELYKLLIGQISPFALGRVGMSPIIDAIAQAGIFDYKFYYSASSSLIELKECVYYPGTNIVNALRNGDTGGLSARERETLEAAQKLAAMCAAPDPLTTARQIHDAICERVIYVDDESTSEDDTAIGAILNGQANCDGYSDAFYLIGTIAGLDVRYQHGDSYSKGMGDIFSDVTHMWNLLEIDGTWRLVDVTWDDQESGTVYTWFNIGEDRAKRMHVWNAETAVQLLPVTDLASRPDNEYLVSTEKDMQEAVKDAVSKGYTRLILIGEDPESFSLSAVLNALRGSVNGSFTYEFNDHMLSMTVIL